MSEEEKQKMKQRRFIIRAGMLIVGLWMSCLFLLFLSPVERGTFGDMFGAINALFSGSALLAAIYAVILQAEELRLTRQELKDTRTELAKQSQVFSDQLDLQRQEMRRERIPFFVITHISRQSVKKSIAFENRGALIADLTVTVSPSKRDRLEVQLTEHPRREDVDVWTLAITYQPLPMLKL